MSVDELLLSTFTTHDQKRFLAQKLAAVSRNALVLADCSPEDLQDFLQRLGLCEPIDGSLTLDFSYQATETFPVHDSDVSPDPLTQNPPSLRVLANESARAIWDHALRTMVDGRLRDLGFSDWRLSTQGMWLYCRPNDYVSIRQGWKLHVSATVNAAPEVLSRCIEVLLSHKASFKHAASIEHLEHLTSSRCDRGTGGKFITVYPADADDARVLCERLHQATDGLPGPRILSDRAYCEGSLVHYRYGIFSAESSLCNDGTYEVALQAPDGRRVPDSRQPWFILPDWEAELFPSPPNDITPASVLLNDRYRVDKVIRHSNRGGVYRAVDQTTGDSVVVKQARRNVGCEINKQDAQHALRREADNLARLRAICPEPLDFFEYQGDYFLVQPQIDGVTLSRHIRDLHADASYKFSPGALTTTRRLALELGELLRGIHAQDLVCRDFTPHNIMIDRDDRLVMIDPELVATPGELVYRYWTWGYGAPELGKAGRATICPDRFVDCYSFGAIVFSLVTGSSPPVPAPEQSLDELEKAWQNAVRPMIGTAFDGLAELILGLTRPIPERRLSLDAAIALIEGHSFGSFPRIENSVELGALTQLTPVSALLNDGIAHVLEKRKDWHASRLWSSSSFGTRTDECNVQHGAGGVLAALCKLRSHSAHVAPVLLPLAHWVLERIERRDRLLPGLYFGATGALWAVDLAARAMDDNSLLLRAAAQWERIPTIWPNPDICHGSAGAGLGLCQLWSLTGNPAIAERVYDLAQDLVRRAREGKGGVYWEIDAEFDSSLKGTKHLGFAHGAAGIGYFLLLASHVCKNHEFLDTAVAAGDLLVAAADRGQHGARWLASVGQTRPATNELHYHWCSGASGIGTYLCRLYFSTGHSRFADLAAEAALATRGALEKAGTAQCHGVAGDAEFLLDMTTFVSARYQSLAEDSLMVLQSKAIPTGGRWLIPDESGATFNADFNAGMSGVLSTLDRLTHPRPRMWMVDSLLPDMRIPKLSPASALSQNSDHCELPSDIRGS